jgi:hypothetical protein
MRAPPPPLLVFLVAAGLTWVAWSVARDLRLMYRTGIARAKYGPTARREKEPRRFQRMLVANALLLLLLVVLVVTLFVSACREVVARRGHIGSEDGWGESRSNNRLEQSGSTPAAQPDR